MKGAFVIVIIALIFYCSFASGIERSPTEVYNSTVEEILKSQFSIFATRLQVVAPTVWNRIVNATANITVFAPTNAGALANNNTNGDQLAYHVVSGDIGYTQIKDYSTLYTLYNEPNLNNNAQVLAFNVFNTSKGLNATINGNVSLVEADIIAKNGIIHSISAFVAIPSQNVGQVLGNNFPTLSALAKRVNQTLTAKYITLLAPTEAAFQTLFSQNKLWEPYLTNTSFPSTFTNINNILNAHVVNETFYPSTLANDGSTFTTLAGSTVRVNRTNTNTFEVVAETSVSAYAVALNMLASNGVAHSIDNVLVPSNINIDLLDALKTLGATSFIDVVTRYNLQGLLNETNIYTIFVPTNAAISKNNVTNQDQAMYHVAGVRNANFNNNLMPSLLTLASLSGNTQKLFGSTIYTNSTSNNSTRYINGVACSGPYMTTRGTYIYTIDTTLQVPVAALSSLAAASFNTFVGLLQETQLIRSYASLNNASTTLFAPTDAAFASLPHGALGFLRTNYTDEVPIATAVINNHIVPANLVYQFNDANISLVTANNGERIDIHTVGKNPVSTIFNGNQRIAISDVPVLLENGVAHPIDQVILPNNVGFNAINLLEGLGNENGSSSWGSYQQFVEACKTSGLIYSLEDDKLSFTVFAPNDDAWNKATEKFDFTNFGNDTDRLHRLQEILNNHIVYEDIDELNNTNWYRVGNTNNTINVTGDDQVTLFFAGQPDVSQGTANIKVNTTTSYMQKIYGIDRVLGVGVENSKKSGLTTLEWILIGVGGAVLGLIILLIVAGAAYYLLVRPKSGYRKIN